MRALLQTADPARAAALAARLLAAAVRRARARGAPAPAVIMDIDDTLVHDKSDGWTANEPVIALFHFARELGAPVHLITARAEDPAVRAWTEDQLRALGLAGYQSLQLLRDADRDTVVTVSRGKRRLRDRVVRGGGGAPAALTVGDQWTDATEIASDRELDALDAEFRGPYVVGRCEDGTCRWFLKLRSYS